MTAEGGAPIIAHRETGYQVLQPWKAPPLSGEELISEDDTKSSSSQRPSMVALGAACLSAVAASIVLWFRPGARQETICGLSVGAYVGFALQNKFRANQREKQMIRHVVASEWEEIVDDVSEYHAGQLMQAVYWIKARDTESLNWLNTMVRIMWPYYNEAICNNVVASLEPMLATFKPAFMKEIKFESFTLGEQPFQFHSMRMVRERDGEPLDNEVEFLMDIRWNGDVKINLAFTVLGTCDFCEIKISDMVIVGTVRVLLRPGVPIIPCFGSISVSFVEPPAIDFLLTLTGALALTSPIQAWIKPMISGFVNEKYVWPQQMVVPMFPEDVVSPDLYQPKMKGILRVRFLKASGLRAVDFSGHSDPYIIAYTVRSRSFTSSIVKNSTEPEWEEEETYFRIMEVSQYLYIQVKDADTTLLSSAVGSLKAEDLGRARVGPLTHISGLINGGLPVERWFDLGNDEWSTLQEDGTRGPGKGAGKILLLMEYMPLEMLRNRKAVLSHRKSGYHAQHGLLFCQLVRGVNLGTSSVRLTAKLLGYPEMTKHSMWKKPVTVEDVAEAQGKEAVQEEGKGDGRPPVLSEVLWIESAAFFDVKCNSTLSLEVNKAKGVRTKPVGRIDIPLALVADHRRKYAVSGLFDLEGTPKKHKYKGAAVELSMEWVPIDNQQVCYMEDLFETRGVLKVRLCHARGLRQTDNLGSTDPFVELKVGKRHRFLSKVVKNNRNPEWMEIFSFPRVDQSTTLMLTVWDEGPISPEHNGDVCVPISAVIRNCGKLSGLWQLQNVKKGSICLDLVWLPYNHDLQPFTVDGPSQEDELFTWPEQPVEELVPPFAFEIEMSDVEVELRGGFLQSEEALGHVHCSLQLKGTTHNSQETANWKEPVWGETFTWQAVQVFDMLDITIYSGPGDKTRVGTVTVELWAVKKAEGTLHDRWEVEGMQGELDMVVSLKPPSVAEASGVGRPDSGACLNVTVISADKLAAMDIGGTSDPAVVLKLHAQSFKTTNKFNTLSPSWIEHFQFLNVIPDDVLEVKVHDYDRVGKYDPLGHVYIPLTNITTAPGKVLQDTWKLEDISSGEITLKLQYMDKFDGVAAPRPAAAAGVAQPGNASQQLVMAEETTKEDAPQLPRTVRGTLKMILHGCSDLPAHTRLLGTMNCYAKAKLERGADVYRSPPAHNSQNPTWIGEEHTFEGAWSHDMLRIRLADKNTVGRDVLGYVMVPVQQAAACAGQPLRKQWGCTSDKGIPAGKVDITLLFEDCLAPSP
mmetsp:Transcript_19224/g.53589  ORF Transcript_19224/g.53589 Transcript_19224/m.53589 type:complete len:1255 (+) Transcript_19224:214-3978(+)